MLRLSLRLNLFHKLPDHLSGQVLVDVFGSEPSGRYQVRPHRLAIGRFQFDGEEPAIDGFGVAIEISDPGIGSEIAFNIGFTAARHDEVSRGGIAGNGDSRLFTEQFEQFGAKFRRAGFRRKGLDENARGAARAPRGQTQ